MGKTASKRKPPSRIRYEQSHPTVSCRVPRKLYDKLRKAKGTDGTSFADILKIGLGILEVRAQNEAELTRKGYGSGYKKGYADAESAFKISYACSICRGILTVTSKDEKEAIKAYMQEHGWGHRECHERRR
jgi:hypothetical protein